MASGVDIGPANQFSLPSLDEASLELERRLRAGWSQGTIDSIFATTGVATFRAYEALARSGLRVPEDIAILGVDDFNWAEFLSAPLSVIAQPTTEMGAAATRIILDEPGESQRLTFSPSLIVRASTTL